jgi:hypothetical protein
MYYLNKTLTLDIDTDFRFWLPNSVHCYNRQPGVEFAHLPSTPQLCTSAWLFISLVWRRRSSLSVLFRAWRTIFSNAQLPAARPFIPIEVCELYKLVSASFDRSSHLICVFGGPSSMYSLYIFANSMPIPPSCSKRELVIVYHIKLTTLIVVQASIRP